MQDFSQLLRRFVGALHADAALKNAVCEAVRECTGGAIAESNISIKDGVLTIHSSPALKNELRLRESRLVECIYEKSGKRMRRVVYG